MKKLLAKFYKCIPDRLKALYSVLLGRATVYRSEAWLNAKNVSNCIFIDSPVTVVAPKKARFSITGCRFEMDAGKEPALSIETGES